MEATSETAIGHSTFDSRAAHVKVWLGTEKCKKRDKKKRWKYLRHHWHCRRQPWAAVGHRNLLHQALTKQWDSNIL